MKLALIGYGKMGKAIEEVAIQRGHEVVAILGKDENRGELAQAEVAIEFSIPDAAVSNIEQCFDANVPVVVGTTGWYDQYDRLSEKANREGKGLFTATNFSVGVNILFHLNKKLAEIMDRFPEYEVKMNETHHIHKLDHPSGTAVTLAQGIIEHLDRKNAYVGQLEGQSEAVEPLDIQIISKRENEVPGYHQVNYTGPIDEISISHNAFNRQGFAQGAVMAAEFMLGKTGVFGMKELLNFE